MGPSWVRTCDRESQVRRVNSGHIHLGAILAIEIALILPFVNLFMRTLAGLLHTTAIGRALAVLY